MITPTNSFAPSLSVGDGTLTVTIGSGIIYSQGSAVTFATTNVVCAANSTTFIFIDLANRVITSNTTGFVAGCYPVATAVTLTSKFSSLTDNRPDVAYNGLEFLAAGVLSLNGTVTFPARDWVEGRIRVRFYGVAGIVSLQFNSDTGNNYVSRAVTMATGGTTWANSIDSNTTNMIRVAPQTTTGNRTVDFCFGNVLNKTKIVTINPATTTGGVGTGAPIDLARGEWFNTAAQVTSITLSEPSGNAFGADIIVFGKNFS